MSLLKSVFSAFINGAPDAQIQKPTEITAVEKERAIVERITVEDMRAFPELPYRFNIPMKKMLQPNSHPFAYIDLDAHNQSVAESSLQYLDRLIRDSKKLSENISVSVSVPIRNMVYREIIPGYGYSKLICSPFTSSGKESKYPVRLSFMTDISKRDETHGEIFYLKSGSIGKAEVNIWINGIGYFYKFKLVDGSLVISEIKSTVKLDEKGLPSKLYKL